MRNKYILSKKHRNMHFMYSAPVCNWLDKLTNFPVENKYEFQRNLDTLKFPNPKEVEKLQNYKKLKLQVKPKPTSKLHPHGGISPQFSLDPKDTIKFKPGYY